MPHRVDQYVAVVDIDTKARRGTGKLKVFFTLINTDIRNAFNTVRWKNYFEAMTWKKVPDNLLRMIDDHLSNRWVLYEGDKRSLKEEMTCGAPEGLWVGSFVWNVMCDDFLRKGCAFLPAGTSVIGFVDDALVVCTSENFRILEVRINEILWREKRWLDSKSLKMAPENTETLLVTDRRPF